MWESFRLCPNLQLRHRSSGPQRRKTRASKAKKFVILIFALNCCTPTLRGLQCTATHGQRVARATRMRMQTTRGPRYAGYPNAVGCDSNTPLLHTDLLLVAVCNHTRTTCPRATRMRMQTTRGPRINMYHANAGYPNAAVCDSALACYIPTFAGCSM